MLYQTEFEQQQKNHASKSLTRISLFATIRERPTERSSFNGGVMHLYC